MYRNLPDLLAIQLESFRYFLEIGLQNQLNQGLKNLGIRNDEIRISPHSCKFSRPKLTPYDAIQSLQTYETIVYCPIEFIPLSLNSIESPSRLISECKKGSDNEFLEKNERNGYYEIQKLPLLTESSYFIVNGIRRVVVNQMVRCPNIYYKVRLLAKNKRTYTVSFISDRGVWIRIERDRHDFLWVRINEARIEMFIFLRALGITDKILTQSLEDCLSIESVDFDRNFILKNFSTSLFESKKNGTKEKTRQFLYENIFNEKKYSLSMSGRMRMNKKFGFSSLIQTLRPEDFLAGLNAFIQLEIGKLPVDDIDHLKNRRVRLLHHLLSDQTRRGLKRLHQENGIFLKNEKNKNENAFDFVEKMQEKNQIAKKQNFISTFPCKTSFLPWKQKSLFQTEPILLLNKNKICQKIPRIFDKKKTKILKTNNQVFKTRQSILRKKISKNTFQKNGFCIPLNASQCFHFNKKKRKKNKDWNHSSIFSIRSNLITKTIYEFFGLSPLSQFMDEINPLSGITQKRRLTCLGPGGVSRQSGVDIRDIHPSHYGRVCPIETPEGKNAGLVNSLASYGSISLDGYIESPYTYFNNSNRNAVVLLKPESQTQEVFYPYKKTLVQDPRGDIRQRKDVCFISISPTGMISVATSLIPFLEHNDGNRALMASNMQRQAVPILSRERPVVGTGFEGIIARDSRSVIIAPFPTRVIYVDAHTIIIENEMTSLEKLSFLHRKMLKERKTRSFHFIETKKSRTKTIDSNLISTHQVDTNKLHVFVEPFSRSNHNTLLYQYPIIKKHQLLNRGEILADTSTSHKGELSLGKNALVAYMPWEGYNFEDAVLFNERLVVDEIFTSIHIEKYKTNTDIHDGVSEELYIPNKNSFSMYMYDRYGIVRPGIFVKSGDILVGKCRPRVNLETPEQKLLYAIFNEIEKPKRIDCSLKLSHGIRGRIFETFFFPKQKKTIKKGSVHVHILIKRPIQIGDKIAGRHGNKGIVSNILPNSNMPYLVDGTAIEIVLNPLGVPSRMNVGQIFECLLGFSGMYLEEYYRIQAFDETFAETASQMLVYNTMKKATRKFELINSFPFAFGKIPLFDGRTGLLFEHPITVGFAYILKLVHLVDDKIHARLQGPYTLITQQPLKGRSDNGGQRLGEMEVWALQGFSVAYILQEMLTLKSDDCSGRIAVQKSILFGTKFPLPFIPESFHVTLIELRALCFNLTYKTYHPRTQKKKKKRKIDKNPRVFMLPIVPSLKKINPILKKRAI